jgi:hypothetical protein
MGWPRKDDEARIYREKDGGYFVVFPGNGLTRHGWDAIANVHAGPAPTLAGTTIAPAYLARTWPKRVQWDELPAEWQRAIGQWLDSPPESIRGFWRIGAQPQEAQTNGHR